MRFYTLNGKLAVPCTDMHQWSDEMLRLSRANALHVGYDHVADDILVSTIFLSLDLRLRLSDADTSPPILFETMVFYDGKKIFTRRYSTWEQAEVGHTNTLDQVRLHQDALQELSWQHAALFMGKVMLRP